MGIPNAPLSAVAEQRADGSTVEDLINRLGREGRHGEISYSFDGAAYVSDDVAKELVRIPSLEAETSKELNERLQAEGADYMRRRDELAQAAAEYAVSLFLEPNSNMCRTAVGMARKAAVVGFESRVKAPDYALVVSVPNTAQTGTKGGLTARKLRSGNYDVAEMARTLVGKAPSERVMMGAPNAVGLVETELTDVEYLAHKANKQVRQQRADGLPVAVLTRENMGMGNAAFNEAMRQNGYSFTPGAPVSRG